jgi:ABC-type branched-subunit amino acid transport system substrate-binding protein
MIERCFAFVVLGAPSTAICSGLPVHRGRAHPLAMGSKSRDTIYGASVRAAAERAAEARKEADRLACEAWNKRMLGFQGPAQPSPTLGDALNAGFGYLEVKCLPATRIRPLPSTSCDDRRQRRSMNSNATCAAASSPSQPDTKSASAADARERPLLKQCGLTSIGAVNVISTNKNNKRSAQLPREGSMLERRAARLIVGLVAALAALGMAVSAHAQEKKIKIGVIYDLSGPLAGGGSELQYTGAKIMLDKYAKTGVEGYKVEAVYADAQSKPDVAINEAVRLIEQEKVDMLLGFFSSAQCVPVAARVEQLKKFMWITTCISSAVLDGKNYKYIFRPQASGDQFGLMTMDFIAQNSLSKFGKEPKDLRVAIIHEDGAYGVDVAKGNEAGAKKAGFNVVLKEGYSATAPDLSALVTKLKRARPDVIFHTGYNPDITLFFRQAREQGLKFGAIVGHGAGYGVYEKLKEGLGADANYIFDTDPISIWLTNPETLDHKLPPVIKDVGEQFDKVKPGVAIRSAHVGMAASNTYVFLTDILPRAIKKYGGVDPDALRKAALDTDIPEGGTMLGFGVKFFGDGTPMAGQNERSFPVVIQYIDDKSYVVWPKGQAQRDAVLPLPAGTTYSYK